MLVEFIGEIKRIAYPKPGVPAKNDFHILIVEHTDDKVDIAVKGKNKNPKVGDELLFAGEYEGVSQYEQQEFKLAYTSFPTLDRGVGLKRYLQKISGEKTGEAIYEKFGDRALDILDSEPQRLLTIPSIKENTMEKILHAHEEMAAEINPTVYVRLRAYQRVRR